MGGVKNIDKHADVSTYQVNTNPQTAFAILNSMIGGTILLLPIYFNNVGYLSSSMVIFITGIMCYKGADIYIQHLKKDEFDSQETIHRILGKGWRIFFVIISTINMFFGCLVYYDFSIDMLYSIITFVMKKSGCEQGNQFEELSKVSYDRFSVQYLAFAMFPVFLSICFLRNFKFLVKLAELGVYSIYSYIVFIIYNFITNITSETLQQNTGEIKLFTWNIGTLGCTASSAFSTHNSVCQIMKCNKDQSKNRFVIKMTYVVGAIIYLIIGIIGALGVVGRKSQTGSDAIIISDYYSVDDWQPLVVQILYFIHLVSMNPIFFDICRQRFFDIIYESRGGQAPKWVFVTVNIFYCLICTLVKILHITPDIIINFNGAFSSFFIIYLIPSLLHLACYHGKNKLLRALRRSIRSERDIKVKDIQDKLIVNQSEFTNQNEDEEEEQHKNLALFKANSSGQKQSVIIEEEDENLSERNSINRMQRNSSMRKSCNDHEDEIHSVNKYVRYFVYIFIIITGMSIFFYGMYSLFDQAINS
ncbi:transmembrane amino acid transporter protein (macronuclear) [Tetrahymena thermophila SB210]|uniref:Transmembrane amino acid transporter protein n=1 Tax=Tetrahymena thermophila (strain SB210) TaxID=312017 RepID=Q239I8_TETTS|nr:transmembrane amino acid transporter protein [Tetrahymena thermophila SB210]EAR93202.1 transmembrane amino acid transporter protein [Tetrahymena thermophila SB210]|eukprot:XP_001013447.1 transmembrane amino acid transporter protein [Tetrahymena thermophila SB210]